MERGELRHVRVSKAIRISAAELQRFMDEINKGAEAVRALILESRLWDVVTRKVSRLFFSRGRTL